MTVGTAYALVDRRIARPTMNKPTPGVTRACSGSRQIIGCSVPHPPSYLYLAKSKSTYRARPSRFPPSPQRPPPLLFQNTPDRFDLFDSKLSLVHPGAEIEQSEEDSQDAQISWKNVLIRVS